MANINKDIIKRDGAERRKEDIEKHGKPTAFRPTMTRNKKAYSRKEKHKVSLTEAELNLIVTECVRKVLTELKTSKQLNDAVNESYNYNKLIPTNKASNVYYHVSNPKNRESIFKNGLIPSVGDSYSAHADGEGDEPLIPVVFLSDNNNYDSTWDDDRWAVDASYLDKSKLYKDFDKYMTDSFVYTEQIPPKALKLIHMGTGKSK